jgi:hypothetical protein
VSETAGPLANSTRDCRLSLTTAISREGAFWVYAGFGVAAFIYFVARVPETKDRTLEEIEQELVTAG